jgi:pSer/pThr/pTyr-binding forkhead associated (FHA) protein
MKTKCGKCCSILLLNRKSHPIGKDLIFKCPSCGSKNRLVDPLIKNVNDSSGSSKTEEIVNNNQDSNIDKSIKSTIGWLILHTENINPSSFIIYKGKNIIGRLTNDNNVDIPIDNDLYLSRKHCFIEAIYDNSDWKYFLVDNGSTNGTYLNTKKLSSNDKVYLDNGDTIQVGRTKLVFKLKINSETIDEATKTVINSDYEKTVII